MSALLALACKCERAGPDSQAALIQQAFEAIHGPKPQTSDRYSDAMAFHAWERRYNRLQVMLQAEAYESAAIALIDEDRREWGVQHRNAPKYPGSSAGSTAKVWRRNRNLCLGKAAPAALAILSAELRARACEVQG